MNAQVGGHIAANGGEDEAALTREDEARIGGALMQMKGGAHG